MPSAGANMHMGVRFGPYLIGAPAGLPVSADKTTAVGTQILTRVKDPISGGGETLVIDVLAKGEQAGGVHYFYHYQLKKQGAIGRLAPLAWYPVRPIVRAPPPGGRRRDSPRCAKMSCSEVKKMEANPTEETTPEAAPAKIKAMRRQPCPCGSGKVFKNCHEGDPGYEVATTADEAAKAPPASMPGQGKTPMHAAAKIQSKTFNQAARDTGVGRRRKV